MKKAMAFLLGLEMIMTLCACGENSAQTESHSQNEKFSQTESLSDKESNEINKNDSSVKQSDGNLKLLCRQDNYGCYTENGYYYLTEDTQKLADGSYGTHLMYMDFATRQEIYLCSNAGCRHNTPDCPSVFLYEDFPDSGTEIFIYKESLYILSKKHDDEGTMYGAETIGIGDNGIEIESTPAVLYRANLDGTSREKVYTFEDSVTLEDIVLGDDKGIYVVSKKISSEKSSAGTYRSSSERKLVFIDLETKEEKTVCSMAFDDNISWNIDGCYDNTIVLRGEDYGRKLSVDEIYDDDAYKNLYENSREVFALLDLKTANITQAYGINNKDEHSVIVNGNILYVSYSDNGSVKSVDLNSGDEKALCTLKNNYLYDVIGDKLCCHSWDWNSDYTFYYVDVNTGETRHSGLVNKCNGWSLEFCAVLPSEVLVIYDYEAKQIDSETYNITKYQCGLISKEDLFAGNDNFWKIKMVGKGR